jgi:uncharacterized repeat protein (TIGR03943 family)
MIVIAIFVLLTSREKSNCGHDHCCDHGHDHQEQNPLVIALLMILPLGASLAADTSSGYSLDLLERKGLYDNNRDLSAYRVPDFTREMLEESTPQTPEGRYQLPVSQLFFSAGDESMMEVFSGLAIETEGQVVPEENANPDGNRLRLYRTMMTCCAADAMVLSFPIEFENSPPIFADRSWVRIGGIMRYEERDGEPFPMLEVETITAISPPRVTGFPSW